MAARALLIAGAATPRAPRRGDGGRRGGRLARAGPRRLGRRGGRDRRHPGGPRRPRVASGLPGLGREVEHPVSIYPQPPHDLDEPALFRESRTLAGPHVAGLRVGRAGRRRDPRRHMDRCVGRTVRDPSDSRRRWWSSRGSSSIVVSGGGQRPRRSARMGSSRTPWPRSTAGVGQGLRDETWLRDVGARGWTRRR
jgi:hypothetical protein